MFLTLGLDLGQTRVDLRSELRELLDLRILVTRSGKEFANGRMDGLRDHLRAQWWVW